MMQIGAQPPAGVGLASPNAKKPAGGANAARKGRRTPRPGNAVPKVGPRFGFTYTTLSTQPLLGSQALLRSQAFLDTQALLGSYALPM
jgi:hypothetical protein